MQRADRHDEFEPTELGGQGGDVAGQEPGPKVPQPSAGLLDRGGIELPAIGDSTGTIDLA